MSAGRGLRHASPGPAQSEQSATSGGPAAPVPEGAVSRLARILWRTNSFTRATSEWAGRPVSFRLVDQERRHLNGADASALRVPLGTAALHRRGTVSIDLGENGARGAERAVPVTVAEVFSAVVEKRIEPAVRELLKRGDIPLGEAFAPARVERATRTVEHVSDLDENGARVLVVSAVLIVSGQPIATVNEVVYQPLVDCAQASHQSWLLGDTSHETR